LIPSAGASSQDFSASAVIGIFHLLIRDRLEKKQLRLHGWWFDIAQADVYSYEQDLH
jgi:carbonic anhydrase